MKAKVKSAVSFIDKYEQLLQELALHRKCDGIICGHIHTPEDKQVGQIHYLNSGDWVESLTAIGETDEGVFELIRFSEFQQRIENMKTKRFPDFDPEDEENEFMDDEEPVHANAAGH